MLKFFNSKLRYKEKMKDMKHNKVIFWRKDTILQLDC